MSGSTEDTATDEEIERLLADTERANQWEDDDAEVSGVVCGSIVNEEDELGCFGDQDKGVTASAATLQQSYDGFSHFHKIHVQQPFRTAAERKGGKMLAKPELPQLKQQHKAFASLREPRDNLAGAHQNRWVRQQHRQEQAVRTANHVMSRLRCEAPSSLQGIHRKSTEQHIEPQPPRSPVASAALPLHSAPKRTLVEHDKAIKASILSASSARFRRKERKIRYGPGQKSLLKSSDATLKIIKDRKELQTMQRNEKPNAGRSPLPRYGKERHGGQEDKARRVAQLKGVFLGAMTALAMKGNGLENGDGTSNNVASAGEAKGTDDRVIHLGDGLVVVPSPPKGSPTGEKKGTKASMRAAVHALSEARGASPTTPRGQIFFSAGSRLANQSQDTERPGMLRAQLGDAPRIHLPSLHTKQQHQ